MANYYDSKDLGKFSTMGEKAPEEWENFMKFYAPLFEDGALTAREKALIALAVAGAVQCPYCIDSYTKSCLQQGVTEEEMSEAFFVAAALRGGATLVHGVQMKNIVKKLNM